MDHKFKSSLTRLFRFGISHGIMVGHLLALLFPGDMAGAGRYVPKETHLCG